MTRGISRAGIIFSIVIAMLGMAGQASGSIVGSKHDFSSPGPDEHGQERPFATGWQVDGSPITEICVFCHTPHGSSTAANYQIASANPPVLWNRSVPEPQYMTYSVYTSPTFSLGGESLDNPPKGITLMCMSCHDGVSSIAVGTLLNAPGRGNGAVTRPGLDDQISDIYFTPDDSFMPWGPNIGNTDPFYGDNSPDLSNDHPVSFIFPPSISWPALGLKPGLTFSNTTVQLFNGRMECSTCHNVHSNQYRPFLRMANGNVNSQMCTYCHSK